MKMPNSNTIITTGVIALVVLAAANRWAPTRSFLNGQ